MLKHVTSYSQLDTFKRPEKKSLNADRVSDRDLKHL